MKNFLRHFALSKVGVFCEEIMNFTSWTRRCGRNETNYIPVLYAVPPQGGAFVRVHVGTFKPHPYTGYLSISTKTRTNSYICTTVFNEENKFTFTFFKLLPCA